MKKLENQSAEPQKIMRPSKNLKIDEAQLIKKIGSHSPEDFGKTPEGIILMESMKVWWKASNDETDIDNQELTELRSTKVRGSIHTRTQLFS